MANARLLIVLCLAAAAAADALQLPPDASFPAAQAERLIRALNLLPKEAGSAGAGDGVPSVAPGELLERRVTLPGLPKGVSDLGHHAGYFRLPHTHDARMFYFFFESRGKKDDPVVIWLTGGPGCSSELAVFYENGPFTIADNMSLVWNQFGWDTISNIIFVDQPTGTGFSYSSDDRDTRHDETGVSNDLYDFLQVFFQKHPEFAKNDFYITGESYAGHYIPAFASRVHQGNKASEGIHINLKGFAIGNGLTDPEIQYKAYTDYALEMNLIEKSDYERINNFIPPCEFAIKMCGTNGKSSCMAAYMVCNSIFNSIMKLVGTKNYYDIRKECEGKLCYDFSNLEKFFGNSRWVHSMEWSGQKDFVSSHEQSFVVDGTEAGVLKSHGPLSFLKVHNAGHMVPMDQPKASLEMLRRFTQGKLKESLPESTVFKAVM
ncbi:hypothetical protein EJB05_25498 [Eragrostis curvula]|uniref:Carboxypeptidase n=1 Tax=Eragrostis curvula TaxID=38414 RepID=A0A5J9VCG7_9POAL|nr:hypothetical protein EJB05_25498 [Eragrostis curvula]